MMKFPTFRFRMRGVTLVELIVAIVILGVALAGVLMVFIRNTSASADPLIWHQATAIAEAYLEEALTKNFTDPDGTNVGETRATYDNVLDYNFTDVGARDQNGNPINGLGGYTVQVQAIAATLNGIPNTAAIRVTVTVTPAVATGSTVVISGYHTNY
ncbi:MAG: prepilin-type N-terminal cleavage/methylation domain-containing protein [Sulfuricaulis sp.]|uniref:type IV pilus modification PilV family protein n=1 Tax=Sulfuricaulis sp. TaxID=2003553 RepID=UPI003C31B89F